MSTLPAVWCRSTSGPNRCSAKWLASARPWRRRRPWGGNEAVCSFGQLNGRRRARSRVNTRLAGAAASRRGLRRVSDERTVFWQGREGDHNTPTRCSRSPAARSSATLLSRRRIRRRMKKCRRLRDRGRAKRPAPPGPGNLHTNSVDRGPTNPVTSTVCFPGFTIPPGSFALGYSFHDHRDLHGAARRQAQGARAVVSSVLWSWVMSLCRRVTLAGPKLRVRPTNGRGHISLIPPFGADDQPPRRSKRSSTTGRSCPSAPTSVVP